MTRNPHTLPSAATAAQRGFSLLEIMIVIVLIGVIATVVGAKIFGANDGAKHKLAQTAVDTVAEKVERYEQDVGSLPPNLDALIKAPAGASGWLGPYARPQDLKDPWNHPIVYKVPGENGPYEVISYGKDGRAGGESVDADIKHQQ